MKKIWQSIVLFFENLARGEIIANEIMNLLIKERNSWVKVKNSPPELETLQFEKEGPYCGALLSFNTLTSTLKIKGEEYFFWINKTNHLRQAAFPEFYKFIPEINLLPPIGNSSSWRIWTII